VQIFPQRPLSPEGHEFDAVMFSRELEVLFNQPEIRTWPPDAGVVVLRLRCSVKPKGESRETERWKLL
jgi:hypothetical protein